MSYARATVWVTAAPFVSVSSAFGVTCRPASAPAWPTTADQPAATLGNLGLSGDEGLDRALGVDVQVFAALAVRTSGCAPSPRGIAVAGAAGRVGGHQDPVAGDQGRGDGARGLLSGRPAPGDRSLPRSSGRSVDRLRRRRADGGDGQDGRGRRSQRRARYRVHRSLQVNSGQLLHCAAKLRASGF
ncbi:hypothetical protein AB0I68_26060 [Streptomyces sp. NPDC050448]|uniref:hypothetical protein n=1 Tax=Streptomyces sp. NPDC050448 TaxID=3155404 RepID=UPI0034239E24